MCGRYYLAEEPKRIYSKFKIDELSKDQPELMAMYNISPGFLVPVIVRNSPNHIEIMKWGLIPHWAKDPKIGYKMINTRAETINQKPSFKSSFKSKRCLVPATGFYEWKKTESIKIPYLIQQKSKKIFSFAGIYDIWKDAEGKEIKTFSIITTNANDLLSPIHNRMPVILEEAEEEIWLNPQSEEDQLLSLLDPYPDEKLTTYTVSTEVNDPKNQREEIIKEVDY